MSSLMQRLMPFLAEFGQGIPADATDTEKRNVVVSSTLELLSSFQFQSQTDQIGNDLFGIEQILLAAEYFAGSLVRDAVSLRRRQLATTGMSHDFYDHMLH